MPDNDKNYMTIEELAEKGQEVEDCTVRGVIIDVKPGSGVMMRCPECKRALYKGVNCRLHGPVKGDPDLRIKAAIDDGTGAMMVVIHRELTEKITNHTLDWYRAQVGETANPDSPRHEIMEKVIARPMEVTGRVTVDDYGLSMIATGAKILDVVAEKPRAIVETNIVEGVKFKFGQLVVTAGVNGRIAEDEAFAKFVLNSLRRHANGDWGDLGKEDKELNDRALQAEKRGEETERLFSNYEFTDGVTEKNPKLVKIYIITEWDRSVTTVLFPDEY